MQSSTDESLRMVSLAGIALQALFALACATVLTMTRRTNDLRSGSDFVLAQVAFLIALLAVGLSNLTYAGILPQQPRHIIVGLRALYLGGKLAFYVFMVLGVAELLGRTPGRGVRPSAVALVGFMGVLGALSSSTLQAAMPAQGLIGLLLMGGCTLSLLRARPPFRTTATTLLALTTAGFAMLALPYLFGWRYTGDITDANVARQFFEVIDRGSFFDLFAQFLLGLAAVALLFERQHEVTRRHGIQRTALEREALTTERLETLGRVAATVAHELNNPLSVVLGTAEHLLTVDAASHMRDDLQLMWREAMRCRHVARELLLFSRDQRPAVAPCDAVRILEDAVQSVQLQAATAGVLLTAGKTVPFTINAEEIALQQVLINLLRNAIDATPRGRTVTGSVLRDGDMAVFHVDDEGPGVPEPVRAQMDDLFFSTKPAGEGTGLGLAIVRGIIARHQGSLDIVTSPDRRVGSRFIVRIPLVAAEPDQGGNTAPVTGVTRDPANAAVPLVLTDAASPRFVLVVDDEVGIRRVLGRLLARRGIVVEMAGDGREAREALARHAEREWTAIFCDVRMPHEGGIEFTGWLEAKHPAMLPRLVLLTGDTISESVTAVSARTGCQLLAKPFRQHDVDEMLRLVSGAVQQEVQSVS